MKTQREVPEANRTSLGLYVTPQEAYEMWKAEPERVHILDVRTFEEYVFGGHVETAKNVPLVFPKFDPEGPSMPGRPPGCSGDPNPNFVTAVQEAFGLDDTILAMCATGGRAAMAVNALAKAGFTHVYNIVDGMEGDTVQDPDSVFVGQRLKNGWKNSGCPWTYHLTPERMLLPKKN